MPRRTLRDRFWSKVDRTYIDGCWEWQGARLTHGYGYFFTGLKPRRMDYAHRVAYELCVGPIPDGLQIDHLCRNRACVNPAHLEPVTPLENTRRGEPARRTHCPQGHIYDEQNTAVCAAGKRHCRACDRDRQRARRAARKAQA